MTPAGQWRLLHLQQELPPKNTQGTQTLNNKEQIIKLQKGSELYFSKEDTKIIDNYGQKVLKISNFEENENQNHDRILCPPTRIVLCERKEHIGKEVDEMDPWYSAGKDVN